MPKINVIIVAGGSGIRMNADIPKQFLLLKGKPVLMHTIEAFYSFDSSFKITVVIPETQFEYWNSICIKHNFSIKHEIVKGGKTRFHSVKNALSKIADNNGLIAVHDGVRPLVSHRTIQNCIDTALEYGNAVPVTIPDDSIRIIEKETNKPASRSKIKLVQTPQVFQAKVLKQAYKQDYIPEFTDDACVVEKINKKINLIEGNRENIKITTQTDLLIAEALISVCP